MFFRNHHCTTITINLLSCSRKKRDTTKFAFKPENVIVLHIKVLDNKAETEIALLLLDPTSTSPLPDSSFTSKELENLIVKIDEKNSNSLPFIMKRVGNVQIGWVLAKHLQSTTQPKTRKSVDILQETCYQQADIRIRSHGLRQLVDDNRDRGRSVIGGDPYSHICVDTP